MNRSFWDGCTGVGGRGCPCAWHAWKRQYARAYKAKQSKGILDRKRMSATTCPRGFGKYGVCGAPLESEIVGGHLTVVCHACERFARGICRDCPRPVAGKIRKARRCADCKAKAQDAFAAKYRANNRRTVRKRARAYYQNDEAIRAARNEYKRAWRKANPEKVKAQKRRHAKRQTPAHVEYHRTYNRVHARKIARSQRERVHGTAPLRTCITPRCSIVLTGRKKKCTKCRERDRLAALAKLAITSGRGTRTDLRRAS